LKIRREDELKLYFKDDWIFVLEHLLNVLHIDNDNYMLHFHFLVKKASCISRWFLEPSFKHLNYRLFHNSSWYFLFDVRSLHNLLLHLHW
jgi:hypothetical protein